jgi:hypothetical protein
MDTAYIVNEIGLKNQIAGSWTKNVHRTTLEKFTSSMVCPYGGESVVHVPSMRMKIPISRKLTTGHVLHGVKGGCCGCMLVCPNLVLIRAPWCWVYLILLRLQVQTTGRPRGFRGYTCRS